MREEVKINYGRPFLKKLVNDANLLGNRISFHINEDGKYVIRDGHKVCHPPTAVSACHFVMGVISATEKIR